MLAIHLIVGSFIFSQALAYTPEALADQITNLPGLTDPISFNQFSGYLQIPGKKSSSKYIHYWLVESENKPATDPLAFWTNGGPGCSGLIGFGTEQGPFQPQADGSVKLNQYAWNKVANMVFIEAPAGVGFSYVTDKEDLTTGDNQTAVDNYNTIQAFLKRFPQYSSNPLYISSESYGGHYMPTLAKEIVDQNSAGKNPILNFKGFAVGNPYTNTYSGTPAELDTYWGHQLVAQPTYNAYVTSCSQSSDSAACLSNTLQVYISLGKLNPYALDYPICTRDVTSPAKFGQAQRVWFANHMWDGRRASKQQKKALGLLGTDEYEPCADNYNSAYLNRADVKQAIHVKNDTKWVECSNTINYSTADGQVSMVPIYQYLINGGYNLNILVYSGDDDSVCATIGTQAWIWGLGYSLQRGSTWVQQLLDGQPVGYLTRWAKSTKLAFLTVHDAGHEVPTYKPKVALDLFTKYLNGEYTN